jgi:2,3-bisphosphoglycerate-independent phosphoglycerate mutase
MIGRLEFLSGLAVENRTKMVLLVISGLGGLPGQKGLTELEAARTPNMDELAAGGQTGLIQPVGAGVTPGSGPGHLALFGYEAREYPIGRGIMEALGVGAEVCGGCVCARGNFCTRGEHDIILDRRAGRLTSERNILLLDRLSREIPEVNGIRVRLYPGQEHRFVAVFSGPGVSEEVRDADPQRDDRPMVWASAKSPDGEFMAGAVNAFIKRAGKVLENQSPANGCLLRGFSGVPVIPGLNDLYRLRSAALAAYPMYQGIARLLGMEVLPHDGNLAGMMRSLRAYWDQFDFFYIHVKKPDLRGADGDFRGKSEALEEIDSHLSTVMDLMPSVFVITGDHATPSTLRTHTWHPVPLLLSSPHCLPDETVTFGERSCGRGSLGLLHGPDLMGLMLAHAQRLLKFGA